VNFKEKLLEAMKRNNSLLCVGLDPYPELMPVKQIFEFNRAIIEATQDLVCAYKPNLAFYEALGWDGLKDLTKTLAFIPEGIPIIGDAKRGDIGTSAKAYAQALFSFFGFDAVTVNPYLGYDSVEPFIHYKEKGIFLLCRTSNPGASDFQDLLFAEIAKKARGWNRYGNIGLVMGATYPQELKMVRELCPDMILLIPGVGAQGGELELSVRYGVDEKGGGAIISASRYILYASKGADFALAARKAATEMKERINSYRSALRKA
jgi:orotidine-5'-phosphate decarboxylase